MKELKIIILWTIILIGGWSQLEAQQIVDRIVAVIGEEIILDSDVKNQYDYLVINGEKDDGSLECRVMEELIITKLLLNKARQDSIDVSEAEVEGELARRMDYILSQIQEEEFEKIYGKSIPQFREDIRDDIKNELLITRQRGAIESETDITPKEVKEFYKSIPEDSLGLLPAEVQINHILIKPPYSDEHRKEVFEELKGLRKQIQDDGIAFGYMASQYTEEPGGRQRKGSLGEFGRGQMVPEFEQVVYNLRPGEVSQPFETEFGVHIVQLDERKGEIVKASHILKRLRVSSDGDATAIDSLNSILKLIETDSLTFEQAAIIYSEDRVSKHCGGCISNPQTQELKIPMDALDPDMYFKIDEMETGEISKPMEYRMPDGTRAFHVIYLKNKIPPHKPSLKNDYQKIRNAALLAKRAENFEDWLESAKKNIYIDIKPTECQNALKNWLE